MLLKSLSSSDLFNPALCYDIETLIEQIWVSYVEKKKEKEKKEEEEEDYDDESMLTETKQN